MKHIRSGRTSAPLWVAVAAVALTSLVALGRPGATPPATQTAERLALAVPPAHLPGAPVTAAVPNGNAYVYSEVAERAVRSVVNISTTRNVATPDLRASPFFNDPFFRQFGVPHGRNRHSPHKHRQSSLGSGVIVQASGVILTNNHVIAKADSIKVTVHDGREFDCDVVGTDPKTDLAVLRLKGKVDKLQALPMADSDKVRLGEIVLAIGNPFGLSKTVTMGIVSAKGRANVGIVDYEDFIQTDAAINPGNSGGALVNIKGELLGINTAIFSRSGGYQGIGFAIPAAMAAEIMAALLADGRVDRGWLGVVIQDMDQDMQKAFATGGKRGVLVSDVAPRSPADEAGILRGDVVLEFDGKEVHSTARLRNLVAMRGSKATVKVEVLRKGRARTIEVRLGAIPGQAKARIAEEQDDVPQRLGLALDDLNGETRRRFGVDAAIKAGALVVGVDPGSPAAQAGIRPGDVLVEVAGKAIRSGQAFVDAVRKKDKVLVLVQRGQHTRYAMLRR